MSKKGPIIIIEDDHDDQEVMREVLHYLRVQNQIIFFGDCDAAYNHLMSTQEIPFLIISDMNLPKMNGIELKQRIDSTDYLRRMAIPFVFMTTSDEPQTVDNAYRITNLQGYFQKGSSLEEIKRRLKAIIDYWSEAVHPAGKNVMNR